LAFIDTLLIFLILFLPFFIIVILPMVLAYYYGSKSLEKTKMVLSKKISTVLTKKFGVGKIRKRELDKLNVAYVFELEDIKFEIDVSFIERRTYAYYFAKIFGGIPDSLFIKATLSNPPPAILYMVSRRKKRLIDKSQKYILVLDEVRVGRLNDKFLILSDNPRIALRYFDTEFSKMLIRLDKITSYIIADYKAPHIELGFEIHDKDLNDTKKLFNIVSIAIHSAMKIKTVKGRGKQSDVLTYVRKILREGE